ncbi:MAG: hypothetical protein E7414_01600 [Ruminococcaceae bacterium]|nr:hypothetical protein [Oscillospiraceae bacterium]
MADCLYIADNRYYEEIHKAFGTGRVILPSACCPSLSAPISCHPDMVLYPAGRGTVVCSPEVYAYYSGILSSYGVKLVQGKAHLGGCYPDDIAYNVLEAGSTAFALWEKTDAIVCEKAAQRGLQRVRVAQGYARCSSLAIGNGLISADPSICAAAEAAGLSVLAIRPGGICLPGYDYGFIGGASGVLENGSVAFFGDLSLHPEGERIRSFIKAQGAETKEICGKPLTDVGTILRIDL